MNIKREWNGTYLYHRKAHHCPNCTERMKLVKVSQIVKPNSPEAAEFNFSFGDTYLVGDTKFIWDEYQCPKCKKRMQTEDMMQYERKQRKKQREKQRVERQKLRQLKKAERKEKKNLL